MTALVFGVSLLASALLALGLPKHYVAWFGRTPSPTTSRGLRALGWCGLPLGLALAICGHGPAFGAVLWAVAVMLAAMAWSLVMALRGSLSAGAGPAPRAGGARRTAPAPNRS